MPYYTWGEVTDEAVARAEGVDPVRASFELIFAHPGVGSGPCAHSIFLCSSRAVRTVFCFCILNCFSIIFR